MAKITKTQLIQLQKKLKTDSKIGETFGITRQAIHQLRKKYGIPSVIVKNKERNEKIIKAYHSGLTGAELAKKFDLSLSQTYRIINKSNKKVKKVVKKAVKKAVKKKAVGKVVKKKVTSKKVVRKKIGKVKKVNKKKVVKKKVVKKAVSRAKVPVKKTKAKKKVVKKAVKKK